MELFDWSKLGVWCFAEKKGINPLDGFSVLCLVGEDEINRWIYFIGSYGVLCLE